jgi:hypothetical protein
MNKLYFNHNFFFINPKKNLEFKKNNEDTTEIPVKILLVEDNSGDVRLFLNEFKELSIFTEFQVVTNGVEALQFLHQKK